MEQQYIQERTAFQTIFGHIRDRGVEVSPRGMKSKELIAYTYVLPPYVRFMNFPSRKLKLDYVKREFLWYLRGDPYDTSITEHASMWKGLINADGTINSNYGQYIFAGDQFEYAFQILYDDKDSRRSAMVILQPYHLFMETKDLPCTYAVSFNIRDDRLNMLVKMRSQDLIFGAGNDVPCFSFIHEMMYVSLRDKKYPELQMGNYFHYTDSLHVYERHYEVLEKIANGEVLVPIDCPRISSIDEVSFLLFELNMIDSNNKKHIPNEYEFSKWLITFDKE